MLQPQIYSRELSLKEISGKTKSASRANDVYLWQEAHAKQESTGRTKGVRMRRWNYPHPIPSEIERLHKRARWMRALEYLIQFGIALVIAGLAGYGLERLIER